MPHHHHGHHAASRAQNAHTKYLQILGITLAIFVVQVTGGYFSNSLSLFSDSVHVASDGLAAYISYRVEVHVRRSSLPPDEEHAVRRKWMRLSGTLLLLSLIWILAEALERYQNPQQVAGMNVMVFAAIGALGNFWQHRLVPHGTSTAAMQRSHVLADLYSSIAVIIGGLCIWLSGLNVIDPILSVLIAICIGWGTIRMMWTGDDIHDHHH